MPADVNADGLITPIDAGAILTYLNSYGAGPIPSQLGSPPYYYDVNGDDLISSIDQLLVINALNAHTNGPPPTGTLATDLTRIDTIYVNIAGLPNTLVQRQTIQTGRDSGSRYIDYEYFNTPGDKSTHGRLKKITDSTYSSPAITSFEYDSRGTCPRSQTQPAV